MRHLAAPSHLLHTALILAFCGAFGAAQAQTGLTVHRSAAGRTTFVTPSGGREIPINGKAPGQAAAPADFLGQYGSVFGITNAASQLKQSKAEKDAIGATHTTYQQVENGVPVFSGLFKVHQGANGTIAAANGRFYPEAAKVGTTPGISAADALAIAQGFFPGVALETERDELVIVDPGWYGDTSVGAHLAYHVVVRNTLAAIREAFFIDARTGGILDRWSMIENSKNREVHDAAGSATLPGPVIRVEGQDPVAVADANLAYDFGGDVYDYYFRAFGRDSVDGAGLKLSFTVNSTAPQCPNAFWDGTQMVFCSGTVTDDIVGHELTHGVTEFSANLIYQNQSGQLNEAFSDVFGEMIDLFNGNAAFPGAPGGTSWPTNPSGPGLDTPNDLRTACADGSVRWKMGEDAAAFGGTIRDMWDPTCFGDPDRANSALQVCNPADSGGVHSGSGVLNHSFAIITDGKTFNGQTVAGIGPIKAGAIYYRALTVYLTIVSDFADAYVAINQAATDLIGTTPNDPRSGFPSASEITAADVAEVNKALLAVELNTDGACGKFVPVLDSTPPTYCPSKTGIYGIDFEAGATGWTTGATGSGTPPNWSLSSTALPLGRPGVAQFVPNPNSACSGNVASTRLLISPAIVLTPGLAQPMIGFTHHLDSESGYDGGNVSINVNGGGFNLVPASAITYNTYNGNLLGSADSNDPLAGQAAWSGGVGSGWGTSIINLAGIAAPGDTIQVRFNFGQDQCSGVDGWYVDDFEVFACLNDPTPTPTPGPSPTASPFPTPTGTPDGCAQVLQDGSFEAGISNPFWAVSSTNFGNPLCDANCGTGAGEAAPRTGSIYCWFGGAGGTPEVGSIKQNVVIASGGPAYLGFYLRISSTYQAGDFVRVVVDGTELLNIPASDPAYQGGYVPVFVDLSAYANGASHEVKLDSTCNGPSNTNFFVDDVSLSTCPSTPSPTTSPTPSPTATSGGYDGRGLGDFDNSHCTELPDFLFLLDYWQLVSPIGGDPIGLPDFLALLDNWNTGSSCP